MKQCHVEVDVVDHAADAGIGDQQDRRVEQLGHATIVEADHRTDPAMAGPFDDQQITAFFQFAGGIEQFLLQVSGRHFSVENLASRVGL